MNIIFRVVFSLGFYGFTIFNHILTVVQLFRSTIITKYFRMPVSKTCRYSHKHKHRT